MIIQQKTNLHVSFHSFVFDEVLLLSTNDFFVVDRAFRLDENDDEKAVSVKIPY